MPSYVEFNKTNTYPASSENGKLTMVLNNSTEIALTDHNGNTTIIGGGGSGIVIPQPIIHIVGYPTNQLSVKFSDTSFLTSQNNAEIFLFRWRNRHRSKTVTPTVRIRRKKSKWYHPSTASADTKWQGWKFFNGKQYDRDGFEITGRITEWGLPLNLLPYQLHTLNFNEYLFWNVEDQNTGGTTSDVNVFIGYDLFTPTDHFSSGDYRISLGGSNNRANIMKYCLAVAIDNPDATKTNGLVPKIFGPFSEPFYSIISKNGSAIPIFNGIKLIKENHLSHKHVIKNLGSYM